MKTRRSLSGKDEFGKEVLSSVPENVASNTDSPSIVRKLRSRVITSDTEDDCHSRSKTSKSNRRVNRENSASPSNSEDAYPVSRKLISVSSEKKTPMRSKRLSAANLFKIEEKEEDKDECEENIKLKRTECKPVDTPCSENDDAHSVPGGKSEDEETDVVLEEIVEVRPSIPLEYQEDSRDLESLNSDPSEEVLEEGKPGADLANDKPMTEGMEDDSASDSDVSDAASSSSSRSQLSSELLTTAEAAKEDHRKRKDCVKALENGVETEYKHEAANNLIEDNSVGGELEEDSGSDDDVPEAVTFSSSKTQISTELSMIAEAVRKEKEKRKERVRKKIEMIRLQKAEKEERRKQKMKFLEVEVPEKLPKDVASGLPDKPDIPTLKKSSSFTKKRKIEKAEKVTQRVEEKRNKILKFDDFIPITEVAGSTQFGIVPLDVASRLPKPSSQSAAEFKRNALFGSRIRREPSKNLLVYHQKLAAAGKFQKGFKSTSLLKM